MTKNILQDVLTRERRSIRRVPLPHKERGAEEADEDILYEREELHLEESSSMSWQRIALWGIASVFLILLGVALLTSFSGATVSVTPKTRLISVNYEFTAGKDEGAKLRFVPLPVSETAEIKIPADTAKKVSEKATGTIIIYNNFSDKPQRLIKNTRFETREGLIYRIGSSITVPGRIQKSGQAVPGSLEVTVTADSPGVEYNIPPTDFTVPGFKTDPARFAGFYARSKTKMSGGFDGVIKVPSDSALLSARASLRETVGKNIIAKKQSAVPQGYVLFSGAVATKNESLPPEPVDGNMSLIKERTIGVALLFKEADIGREVAKLAIPNFNNLLIEIPALKRLQLELKEPQNGDVTQAQTIRFTLKGEVLVVWRYDEYKLREALLGKPRDGIATVLSDFPEIERADFVIRPVWSRKFPENPKKISFEEIPVGVEK
ncbi:MAG TPA: hypothetical protein DEF00_00315 [Candidatus Taylorbacteria bacterium]|nr:MAG: hypothetical protein UY03_C0002G0063 [Parcubacteria group bacterium GW2011_GWA2_47_64]KKU96055.1 MAG: hypothetical protein UY29_C0016G0013 [Parcubacteria group bacterium GW2011_GWC2_48_17]HBV00825.1 hypothetical protein [Candidatus Taylorbacteria bacterium]